MSYTVRTYRNFNNKKLKESWKRIYDSLPYFSEFVSYEYMRNVARYVSLFMPGYRPTAVTVEDEEGRILMIAPLKINLKGDKFKALGDVQGCGKTDFIIDGSLSDDQKREIISFFFSSETGRKRMYLGRLLDGQPVETQLAEKMPQCVVREANCVAIDSSAGFDALFASLSKNVRQNVRTAYNRMVRDDVDFHLKVWMPGDKVDGKSRSDMVRMYVNRVYFKYRVAKGSKMKKLLHDLLVKPMKIANCRFAKHDTISLFNNDSSFHVALYGNGRMMAFMSGFMNRDKSIAEIPRLAINDEFSFYSPGYVMICEFLKAHHLDCLDLLRGTEKYKLDLGGKIYHTHSFKLPHR